MRKIFTVIMVTFVVGMLFAAGFLAMAAMPTDKGLKYPPAVDGKAGKVTGRVSSLPYDTAGVAYAYVSIVNASNFSQEYFNATCDGYGNFQIVGVNASYNHNNESDVGPDGATPYVIYANKSPYGEGHSEPFGIDSYAGCSTPTSVVLFPSGSYQGKYGPRTIWSDMGDGGVTAGRVGLLDPNHSGGVANAYVALVNASNVNQEYCHTTADANGYYRLTCLNATYSSKLMQGPHGMTGDDYTRGTTMYKVYARNTSYGEGYSDTFGIDADQFSPVWARITVNMAYKPVSTTSTTSTTTSASTKTPTPTTVPATTATPASTPMPTSGSGPALTATPAATPTPAPAKPTASSDKPCLASVVLPLLAIGSVAIGAISRNKKK